MNKELKIEAVMHPFPHTVGADQSLQIARDLMSEHEVRHLPVQKAGKLIGVISDRDINFALAVDKTEAEDEHVEDAFTEEPYVVEPTEPVYRVARRMAADHIGCALVAKGESVVGIFTTVDACRTLADQLSGE